VPPAENEGVRPRAASRWRGGCPPGFPTRAGLPTNTAATSPARSASCSSVARKCIPVSPERAAMERRCLRGRRQGDISYWGVGGRRAVALLLGVDDRCASLGRLRTDGLGAMRRVLLTPVPDAEPCSAFRRNQAESEHICDAVTPLTPRVRRRPRALAVAPGQGALVATGQLDFACRRT
jgi:hypothetical protein